MILLLVAGEGEEWSLSDYAAPPVEAEPLKSELTKPRRALARERFYRSDEWAEARRQCLERDNWRCVACGATDRLNADHVLPRSRFPELALEQKNLRVLCWPRNKAKNTKIDPELARLHLGDLADKYFQPT